MKVAVLADDYQWEELKSSLPENECFRAMNMEDFISANASIFLYLKDDFSALSFSLFTKPIIINSVTATLQEINAPANVFRINGWQTFLQRPVWEIAGKLNESFRVETGLLNKKLIHVPDEVGFPSARVVAMIINEAFFALQDDVSTKNEIDIAMKLGTNYPYGPFEWADKIGKQNIYTLLKNLSKTESRYTPSAQLQNEIQGNI